ncbi:hemin receptor [Saccharobesus litoralis]|uniref:Hemin receptor n=1 Tax=Saccharobesus litoralis TaxID=2172099 RepID=A0A2S0VU52_9ALTE|nr:globin family protein [Saccharobesus litoralis]AWB67754.1 hemin receptor [Saccharobesus litoralis]
MTPQQINLVQQSWEQVVPIAKDAANLFYNKLFELDPSLRSLFSEDIEEQGKKLMTVLTTVVRGLKQLDKLTETVWLLGRRHNVYGVSQQHYTTVAAALLWTLEQGLGTAFTTQVKDAWVAAYTVLAQVMQAGASYEYASFDDWQAQQT